MNKTAKLLIASGYFAIIIFTVCTILAFGRSYTVYLPNPYNSHTVEVVFSEQGIVGASDVRFSDKHTSLELHSVKTGSAEVTVSVYNESNMSERTVIHYIFTVLPTGVLYLSGYDYGGNQFTLLGMTLISVYSFAVCLVMFIRRRKLQFFSHKTMLYLALSLFFAIQSCMYTGIFVLSMIMPERVDGWHIYNLAGFFMSAAVFASIPFLVIFSGFMSVSNLSLIRHEGLRKNNLFGILISLVLFAGSVMCVIAAIINPNSTGVELSEIRDAVIRSIVSSAFVYFECILVSSIICTQYAARHEPSYDQDFIIILGCRVGKDSKPLPLLRGRIDRALEFYHKQLAATGKRACFIPSGGKGSDEVISEAECMRNYLIEHGIDESAVYPETESTTTLENMKFSKKIADSVKENANIIFSTTNYHVFRSGVFSVRAGLRADGIGAKTKWYFWPNAQVREFIGLLASEWKTNIAFIAAIVFLSTLFANISTMVSWIVA